MSWKTALVGLVIFSVGCALFRVGPKGRQGVREEPATESETLTKLVDLAKGNLARRLGVGVKEVTLVSAEAVEWPDASLGNPQPGMVYAQVIIPGYKIILSAGGQEYEYHSDQERVILVEDDG
ncbi:MAG: hypothetical protein ACE5II_03135 [Anaerolineae bacterium]